MNLRKKSPSEARLNENARKSRRCVNMPKKRLTRNLLGGAANQEMVARLQGRLEAYDDCLRVLNKE